VERVSKEVVVTYFKVPFQDLSGETEEKHEESRDLNCTCPKNGAPAAIFRDISDDIKNTFRKCLLSRKLESSIFSLETCCYI
jgi:hypothetical protein